MVSNDLNFCNCCNYRLYEMNDAEPGDITYNKWYVCRNRLCPSVSGEDRRFNDRRKPKRTVVDIVGKDRIRLIQINKVCSMALDGESSRDYLIKALETIIGISEDE